MKIRVHYDFTQQKLVGKEDIFEIADGAKLGELLQIIDAKIIDAGKIKDIDTTYKTTLVNDQLNGCVAFINGSAPENMQSNCCMMEIILNLFMDFVEDNNERID